MKKVYKNLMRLILLHDLFLPSRMIFLIKIWAFRIFKTKIQFLEDKIQWLLAARKHSKDEINLLIIICKRIIIVPQVSCFNKY